MRRYSRQILLREVGGRGQSRILQAEATLFARGAMGEAAAHYLLRSGVERLRLYADDEDAAARFLGLLSSEGDPSRGALLPLAEVPPVLREAKAGLGASFFALGRWEKAPDDEVYFVFGEAAGVTVGQGLLPLHAELLARGPLDSGNAHLDAATGLLAGAALALMMLEGLLGLKPPPVLRISNAG